MKRLINKISQSRLLSVSFFSAVSTLIKMITAFFTAKIISVYLGPQGLGIIGQLNSFVVLVLGVASGSISNGVIKYISEYKDSPEKQREVINASVTITIICSVLVSAVILCLPYFWTGRIFGGNSNYVSVLVVFGFTLIFYSVFSLIVSIINGMEKYKTVNYINIVTSIIGFIFTLLLIHFGKLMGALYAAVTYQSVVFFIALWVIRKDKLLNVKGLFSFKDKKLYANLLAYSLMTLTSIISIQLSQLYIRNYLTTNISPDVTGYYEGMARISSLYLTIISTTLTVYYLPRLSSLSNGKLIEKEMLNAFKIIIPITLAMVSAFYFFRELIIVVTFTADFLPMKTYFLAQLTGDLFKVASWLIIFLLLAKRMLKVYIFMEVFSSLLVVVLTRIFVSKYGGEGAPIAYCLSYMISFCGLLLILYSYLKKNKVAVV